MQRAANTTSSSKNNERTWVNFTLLSTSLMDFTRQVRAKHAAGSFASNFLVFVLLSLILGGLGISLAAFVAEKNRRQSSTDPVPEPRKRVESATVQAPNQPYRRQMASSGRVLAAPANFIPRYAALCPQLVKALPRTLTCSFAHHLSGERQAQSWQIFEDDEVLMTMRLDEVGVSEFTKWRTLAFSLVEFWFCLCNTHFGKSC